MISKGNEFKFKIQRVKRSNENVSKVNNTLLIKILIVHFRIKRLMLHNLLQQESSIENKLYFTFESLTSELYKTIRSVQNHFLRPIHELHQNILNLLNLSSLNDRSSLLLSIFLRFNNCPELFALIQFKINSFNTRNPKYININNIKIYLILICYFTTYIDRYIFILYNNILYLIKIKEFKLNKKNPYYKLGFK
ncbi:RNA-directed DNA polymerase from mobile element jockey [Aphis craccivora]|uniref:RNA-directed DNA polymerase from mobile element jockey n=1 Tax=Aphis craccivora TaxID=307492 RepID=A0A6G0ZAT7_APHCR|nr:RNA-directed DNA polymerase from mobile element jockey [Aphis craccivora]